MNDNELPDRVVKNTISIKIGTIVALILVLLIPMIMIKSLINERQARREAVVAEISSKWGNSQTITGPIITVPYSEYVKDEDGKERHYTRYLTILPDELEINGNLNPEIRYRGIYEAVLYNATIDINGSFQLPSESQLGMQHQRLSLNQAFITLGISDMRGIKDQIQASFGSNKLQLNPGVVNNKVITSGVSSRIHLNSKRQTFHFTLNLNGSQALNFAPIGKTTTVNLESSWDSPSFTGAFLPEERQINNDGFKAGWKVLHFNRNYPQFWTGAQENFGQSTFGVNLFMAVDLYQQTMRITKYAIMFFIFTFMAFFLSEIFNNSRLHPIQYLMVGLAITLFYALLISISEHASFDIAYLISSVAVVTMVGGYAKSILHNGRMAAMVTGILIFLYSFLYLLLQLEDYALLMGSMALFVALGVTMFLTRKIDWYAVGTE